MSAPDEVIRRAVETALDAFCRRVDDGGITDDEAMDAMRFLPIEFVEAWKQWIS